MNSIKHKTARKITSVLLSATTMVWLAGASAFVPTVASADAATDALIAQLQAQIAALTAQLAALSGSSSSSSAAACSFSRSLTLGSQGADVTCLQNYLMKGGYFTFSGGATGYFGSVTKAAVAAWQAANGVSPAAGYFGPLSQAKYSSMVSSTPPSPTPTGGPVVGGTGLMVSAGSQPANSLAPTSAARVPFTRIVLTASADGDVTVNGVTVERTGLANDAVFSGIVLLDENGNQVGLEKTLNSDHKATVGDTFVIPRGMSKTYTVAGNMASSLTSYAGQVAYLTVAGVNSAASVSGSLPITGAAHTINASLSIGTVTLAIGPLDPNNSSGINKKVGDSAIVFSSINLTAGSAEKVVLRYIRWNQSGSAAAADLANVKTYVDGTAYDTVVSSDGKYYTTNFPSGGLVIDKGATKEILIKGDVAGGSGRTIDFDIYRRTDLAVDGQTYGYGIVPPNGASDPTDDSSAFSNTNPWWDATQFTVTNGTITVTKATSVAAQNVAKSVVNQPLGGYDVEVKGEPITVASMVFYLGWDNDAGDVTYADVTSVSLVKSDGTVVAGPVDAAVNGSGGKVTFTDSVTFPVGKATYSLKGKLGSNFDNNDTISASSTPGTDWTSVTGQTTGNTITPSPSSSITGNTMTVKAVALTVSQSSDPPAQTVVAGAQGFVFAKYQLDASASGEDVRLGTFPAAVRTTAGSTVTNLTGCQLWDGATSVTSSKDPSSYSSSTSFTFTGTGYTVPKGTVKTLSLACNIAGSTATNSTYAWGYDPSTAPTITGTVSGNSTTATTNSSQGQLITISSGGSLTVTKDSSSPSYTIAAGGASNVTLGVLKFHATNEAINLKKVALQLTAASSSPSDLTQVTLWDGATQVGSAIFISDFATSTLTQDVIIPKDGDKLLTVKADLAAIGNSQVGTEGAFIKVNYDGGDSTGTQGVGSSSGTTVNQGSSSDTAVDGLRMFKSYPTVAKLSVPSTTLSNGDISLLRFSITANSAGDVGLAQVSLKIATTTAVVDSINIYGYTDSSFSTPVSGVNSGGKLMQTDKDCQTVDCESAFTIPVDSSGTGTVLQIPAGATRYFDVHGTVTGTASGAVVSTQLEGDAAFPVAHQSGQGGGSSGDMAAFAGVDADTNGDFIWSPNATTSVSLTDSDFTNGYGVPGLPGTNLTAESVSK